MCSNGSRSQAMRGESFMAVNPTPEPLQRNRARRVATQRPRGTISLGR